MSVCIHRSAMFLIHLSIDHTPTPLPSGELILVGRGEQCDLRLADPSASRVHCRLLSRDGKVILTDAGSRWGTFVNGERVTDCELQTGDEITIGETTLRLAVTSTPDASTLARPSQLRRDGPAPAGLPQAAPTRVDRERDHRDAVRRQHPLRAADFLGQSFADCQVEELIARTRTGLRFRAVRGGEAVDLQLFHPDAFDDDAALKRFHRAVETTRALRHPNLVTLHDGGVERGVAYAVSEFVPGETAADRIRRSGVAGMLDWRTTLRMARDLSVALVFLESQEVLHRNITPDHVVLGATDDAARLSDLLLAKAINDSGPAVTNAGETVGELPYLSPEQVGSGQPLDHRSDIYQLGATLYALLTGRPPFEGRGPAEIIPQVLRDRPTPPTRYHLAIPPQLEGTVLSMLEKRPGDRFHSAADLSLALDRVQQFTN
ncbi:MAG: FHA domain-containing protein [Planctomycetaceae bacterium]|nr:FHA domain-containing protein [Planctomycetaceae bacterium]